MHDSLAVVQGLPPSDQTWEAKLRLRSDMLEMLRREECLWKQKAKVTWLTTSDLNTRFFHLSTIIRRRRNNIEAIKNGRGVWLHDRANIGTHIEEHFCSLFGSAGLRGPIDDIETLIQPVLTGEDNSALWRIPSTEEIQAAIENMGALKAPGPNGM